MSGMKWFCNVGGGEFHNNLLFSFRGVVRVFEAIEWVQSEGLRAFDDGRYEDLGELFDFEKELNKGSERCWLVDKRRFGKLAKDRRLANLYWTGRTKPAYLCYPFLRKLLRLPTLDSQRWYWQNQIALLQCLGPLQSWVHDRGINARYLCQD